MWRLLALVLLTACTEEDRAAGDETPDAAVLPDDGAHDGAVVVPPAEPSAPQWACAPGWRPVVVAGATVCDPYPESGRLDCPDGEAHFPGEPGCAAIGPTCPSGEWATDLPSDGVVFHVSSQPGEAGDGSAEAPFRGLGPAFRASSGGEIFALSKGTHSIEAAFPDDTVLWGACASGTRLEAAFPDDFVGTFHAFEQARSRLRNLTVAGTGTGIVASEDADLLLEHVVIEGTSLTAVLADLRATVRGHTVLVRDTVGVSDGGFGRAIVARAGATVSLERVLIEQARDIAVSAYDPGTTLTLKDAVIAETQPDGTRGFGRGLEVIDGAHVTLERAAIEDNLDYAVFAGGNDADVTLSQTVIRRTRSRQNDGEAGRGLSAQEGASLTGERLLIDDNREIAAYGSGTGQLGLRDVVVHGTRARAADGLGGRGIQVQGGIAFQGSRLVVGGNEEHGVMAAMEGTDAELEDLVVDETAPTEQVALGRGIEALLGAHLSLRRVHLTRNHDAGIMISDPGTECVIDDLTVSGTRPNPDNGQHGRGLAVRAGATLRAARVTLRDNTELGVLVSAGDATITDLLVERTLRQPCAETNCPMFGLGVGLVLLPEARLTVERFLVSDNALAGALLTPTSQLIASDGTVRGHPIGAHMAAGAPEFDDVFTDVRFEVNDRNVDSTALPIPEPLLSADPRFGD